jgi:hypothetical protein
VRKGTAVALEDHALDQLTFIRTTMQRATAFTAIPGWGGVVMGAIALTSAAVARRQVSNESWLAVWLVTALLAVLIGVSALILKARRLGFSLRSESGRKFVIGFTPPILAVTALSWPLFQAGMLQTLAAAWLLSYGCAVAAGGTYSEKIVPAMGLAFLILGGLTLLVPAAWRDLMLGAGFGGLHIIFGFIIARKYGG